MLLERSASGQINNAGNNNVRTTVYMGVVHPVGTWQDGSFRFNFSNAYTIGFPVGINIQKSKTVGFSLEIAPFIVSDRNVSKVKTILVHPGVYFPLKNGWTITNRLAFETTGRYGVTPSVSKMLLKGIPAVIMTIPLAVRFGNDQSSSLAPGVLITLSM